jgi:D-alanyl-D-alanine carboxypeptidase (penicillin-binding protein 5/6)
MNSPLRKLTLPIIVLTSLISTTYIAFGNINRNILPIAQVGNVLGMNSQIVNPGKIITKNRVDYNIQSPVRIPKFLNKTAVPPVSAGYIYIMDRSSKTPLYEENENTPTYPASTTKIATAIVEIERGGLEIPLLVPNDLYERVNGSWMGLKPGDLVNKENLLWGMLVNSGNDAAWVLNFHHNTAETSLVDEMNELVGRLGLTQTHFVNAVGFDEPNHITTAKELAHISDYALKIPIFSKIVSTKSKVITSLNPKPNTYFLQNTNGLLGKYPGVYGVKTGTTDAAGGVLVSLYKSGTHEVIIVIMKSFDRENDTIKLIEWVKKNYTWS